MAYVITHDMAESELIHRLQVAIVDYFALNEIMPSHSDHKLINYLVEKYVSTYCMRERTRGMYIGTNAGINCANPVYMSLPQAKQVNIAKIIIDDVTDYPF